MNLSQNKIDWMRERQAQKNAPPIQKPAPAEQHFSAGEIAKIWHCNEETVRKMFASEPGVLNIGSDRRRFLRIPASVLERVSRRRTNV